MPLNVIYNSKCSHVIVIGNLLEVHILNDNSSRISKLHFIGADSSKFRVMPTNGELQNTVVLDYESGTTSYTQLWVWAIDDNFHSSSTSIIVNIADVNDETPSCPESLFATLQETDASKY